MDLVGRAAELDAGARAVDGARDGEARVLLVAGEAGIGKSALLAATGARARAAGLLVLEGRAAEHERDVPFGLVVDALDDHVAGLHPRRVGTVGPDLAAVLPAVRGAGAPPAAGDGSERFRYHRALRALLELLGRERPLALLLDDLHWADAASVELVLHLLRRPPRVPHLLAVATRPVDPAPRLLDAMRGASARTTSCSRRSAARRRSRCSAVSRSRSGSCARRAATRCSSRSSRRRPGVAATRSRRR